MQKIDNKNKTNNKGNDYVRLLKVIFLRHKLNELAQKAIFILKLFLILVLSRTEKEGLLTRLGNSSL